MAALALRIGNPVNQTELARDLGIPQRTISRWIDLLETSWLLKQLPAYTVNRTSRLMKRPKLYWADSGLALHLAGAPEPSGAHLENLVLSDILAWGALQPHTPEIMYWRTVNNDEVDFVIEWRGDRDGGHEEHEKTFTYRDGSTRKATTIRKRVKDVIKTGGEWVSSLDLESLVSRHPAVSEVAAIAVKDDKWGERPLGVVVAGEGGRRHNR